MTEEIQSVSVEWLSKWFGDLTTPGTLQRVPFFMSREMEEPVHLGDGWIVEIGSVAGKTGRFFSIHPNTLRTIVEKYLAGEI